MLPKKKKQPNFKKDVGVKNSDALKDFKSCDRIFKGEPLEKQNMPTDNRKAEKVTREHYREHLAWMGSQSLKCHECGAMQNIELHHAVPQQNKSVIPFCQFCHRGDKHLFDNRDTLEKKDIKRLRFIENSLRVVVRGYCIHRGTLSGKFNEKWNLNRLLLTADNYVKSHEMEIGRKLKK